jgi:hypothetical protein
MQNSHQTPTPQPADLVAKTRAALAELKEAEARFLKASDEYTAAACEVTDKLDTARDLVVELHTTRPHRATTKWTAEQAGCSQRLVQQLLKEAGAADPDAEHDELKKRNAASQRKRRARQRGAKVPETAPSANDTGSVIRGPGPGAVPSGDDGSNVIPFPQPGAGNNLNEFRLEAAKKAVDALDGEQLEALVRYAVAKLSEAERQAGAGRQADDADADADQHHGEREQGSDDPGEQPDLKNTEHAAPAAPELDPARRGRGDRRCLKQRRPE